MGRVMYLDINFLKVTFTEYNFYSYTFALVFLIPSWDNDHKTKLRGLSLHANYTDRAAAAGRRS